MHTKLDQNFALVMLAIRNAHKRDVAISFDEPSHTYTVDKDNKYVSVTTWIHSFFGHFDADAIIQKMRRGRNWGPDNKYYNMTDEEIKKMWKDDGREAATLGTRMHACIENFYNGKDPGSIFWKSKEGKLFQEYLDEEGMRYTPYRSEWTVYSKKYRIAGSIDMVYVDPDVPDAFYLADWKRAREIKYDNPFEKGKRALQDVDNCNYMHYSLQLNIYRTILENYYGLFISKMFLIILHPNQDTYLRIDVPRITDLVIAMFEERLEEIQKS